MKNFIYYTPTKVYFGRDEHKKIGEILKALGYKKIMLHYGSGSIIKSGLYECVKVSLEENGIEYVPFGGVKPNPVIGRVIEGAEICRREKVELVLAVGGGSVIDSAKAIAAAVLNSCDPWLFFEKKASPKAALPVAVILTLSATGSEMSASAVITNEKTGTKRGYNSDFNRPLFSILNPELTYTVSSYQTACGIVDIMMHTLERYITKPGNAEPTDQIAESVLRTVISCGLKCLENPTDYDSRAGMMWSGSLSHNDLTGCGRESFSISHQIEHEISGKFPEVAHGAGLAVIFPAWSKYIYRHNTERFYRYATEVMGCEKDGDITGTALKGIIKTEELFRSIGMPTHMSELGITEESFIELAENCTQHGTRKMNALIDYSTEDIYEIFRLCK